MTKDEALKLALEALENNKQTHHYCEDTWYSCPKHEDGCANDAEGDECNCGADKANAEIDATITAIKEALAQPQPWEKFCDSNCVWTDHHPDCKLAQRKPLSDEEIEALWPLRPTESIIQFARAIEAAHGIKGLV